MRETGGRWALIVHGGAKTIEPHEADAHRRGCLAAAEAGAALLRDGGSALDAAEAAVRVLEDDPTFNAGYGSVVNANGEVEMDAAIMDGATLDVGAVAAVRGVRHPVSAARLLLREKPVLLVGEGAGRFARERGAETCPADGPLAANRTSPGHDTVGCVALDQAGNVAAATSTGGLDGTMPGRVGDSPMPGCGFYADDLFGGAAFSGEGESIARLTLAARVLQVLESGSAGRAAAAAIDQLARIDGEAGTIVLDKAGRFGVAHNSDHFAVALAASGHTAPVAGLHQDELKEWLDHG